MRNRGIAAILAMIFLVFFSVLGISFCSLATSSMHGAKNDRDAQVAMAAAESGMAFIQRTIADITMTQSQATGQAAMQAIYSKLRTLDGTATLGGQSITVNADFTTITVPAIALHANEKIAQRCTAQLTLNAADLTADRPDISLRVTGSNSNNSSFSRTLMVTLTSRDRTLEAFTYGVFAKGRVDLADGKASVIGTPASAGSIGSAYTGSTAIFLHGGDISGNVYVSGDPSVLFATNSSSGSVGGVDIHDSASLADALTHVHEIDPPTIPLFNANQFAQLDSSGTTKLAQLPRDAALFKGKAYSDVCITQDVTFAGNDVLQGLIYVKRGVTVRFNGNPTIQGVIVVEDPNLDANGVPIAGSNVTSTSTLNFLGTPIFATPVWPMDSIVPLEQQAVLADYSVLGPSAYIYISGNGGSNKEYAGFGKTVVCGTLEEYGSGMVKIRDGTLITMSDTMVTGTEGYSGYFDGDGVEIQRSPGYHAPYGGYVHLFSWVIESSTYREVTQ